MLLPRLACFLSALPAAPPARSARLRALASSAVPSPADTVYALSSGRGAAGVAVVRISGPAAGTVATGLLREGASLPPPRTAGLRTLVDPSDGGAALDESLVLWFPGPASFTGEDVVELHVHGGRATVDGVLGALAHGDAARLAERGEFTRRAYARGRLGLTEVEGLSDLIAADTAAQRKQALRQMGGALRKRYDGWRGELTACVAFAEASIDFGDDEDDVDEAQVGAQLRGRVDALRDGLRGALASAHVGEAVRGGVSVAIAGAPNAGKSSLLNLLAARDAAIVTDVPGTTRDVLEVRFDLGGVPVTLADTAGLRDAPSDVVEAEGIRRAAVAARDAHLTLFVADSSAAAPADGAGAALASLFLAPPGEPEGGGGVDPERVMFIANKIDAAAGREALPPPAALAGAGGAGLDAAWHPLSCTTGQGLEAVLRVIEARVTEEFRSDDAEPPTVTRRRHRAHLASCLARLDAFVDLADRPGNDDLELMSEELRSALRELGKVVGEVDVEDVLDVLFAEFCIGK